MEILINSKGIHVGDSLKAHIEDHMSGLMSKYFKETSEIHITLFKGRQQMVVADIAAHVGRGLTLRSHGDTLDPYSSFDMAFHKIEARLRRYKNRIQDYHLKQNETPPEQPAPQYVLPHDYAMQSDQHNKDNPAVVAELEQEVPTLSVSDAVMRMDLSDAPVLVFRNKKHGGINVVHRRHDGNIGWIDPDGAKAVRKIT